MSSNDILIGLAARVSQEPYWKEVSIRVQFIIEDCLPEGQKRVHTWLLDTHGTPRFTPSQSAAPCTIRMDAMTLQALVAGSLNPQRAYLEGRISVEGEAADCLKICRLFPPPEQASSERGGRL